MKKKWHNFLKDVSHVGSFRLATIIWNRVESALDLVYWVSDRSAISCAWSLVRTAEHWGIDVSLNADGHISQDRHCCRVFDHKHILFSSKILTQGYTAGATVRRILRLWETDKLPRNYEDCTTIGDLGTSRTGTRKTWLQHCGFQKPSPFTISY